MTIDLAELAKVIETRSDHVRCLGNRVMMVCGPVGRIDTAGQVHLRLAALSEPARAAAEELVDADCIEVSDSGHLFLSRLPHGFEITLLRRALGLPASASRCVRKPESVQ